MAVQRITSVLWSGFLGACLLEGLVFAVVDPLALHWLGQPLDLSRQGVYSLAFFAFWAVAALVSSLTLLVGQPGGRASIDRVED
ncbi:hypothetical protein [Rhodoferax sp.]|uniref:hypothetical protein n=1 Tax=Rhodoferax sp. TaxID=50421 RepID=UPI0025D7BE05|nr:hypothetical protein [Rhodoferax sp.]